MQNVSIRLPEDLVEELDDESDEKGVSRTKHIRTILESRHEHTVTADEHRQLQREHAQAQRDTDRLRDRLESREKRIDDLEEQLGKRSEIEEKVDVLANTVEEREERAQRQLDREDALASAGPLKRFTWWATGTDPAETVESEESE